MYYILYTTPNKNMSMSMSMFMFFQFLSTIKVNLVAKIMHSAFLCVIFHVKHKQLPFLAVVT